MLLTLPKRICLKQFTKLVCITRPFYNKLRLKVDMARLYAVLDSDADIHSKKHYVYALSIKRSRQDLLWEIYNEGQHNEPKRVYKKRGRHVTTNHVSTNHVSTEEGTQ